MRTVFTKLKSFKQSSIFHCFNHNLYFGTYKLKYTEDINHLVSNLALPLFIILVILRKKISITKIIKVIDPVLSGTSFTPNQTFCLTKANKGKYPKENLSSILRIASKRNYYPQETYYNSIFVEVSVSNLKRISDSVNNLDEYSRVFLKVTGLNAKNYKLAVEYLNENPNVLIVDKFVPSINIVDKVSKVYTDNKVAYYYYTQINSSIYIVRDCKYLVETPGKLLCSFEDKFLPYEEVLLNNTIYSFLLSTPDQLFENNKCHIVLLKQCDSLEINNEVTAMLCSLVDFIQSPSKGKEDRFVKNYLIVLEKKSESRVLNLVSEILIVNCKLDLLNNVISKTLYMYFDLYINKGTHVDKMLDILNTTQLISLKLSGRIVNYNFLEEEHYLSRMKLSVDEVVVFIRIFLENRSENHLDLLLSNTLMSCEDVIKVHGLIAKDFIKLGELFDCYYKYWIRFSKVHTALYNQLQEEDISINPFCSNYIDASNKKIHQLENLNKWDIHNSEELSEHQKYILFLQGGYYNEASLIISKRKTKKFSSYLNFKSRAEVVRHLLVSEFILFRNENNGENKDTVIVDMSLGCMNSKTQFFSLLPWINKSGIQFCSLLNSSALKTKEIDPELLIINKKFNYDWLLSSSDYVNKITLDLENKKISYKELNFYHGFYERIACMTRTYDIDWNLDANYKEVVSRVRITSIIINYLESAFIYAKKNNKRLIFVSGNSHLAPYSCIRDYILSRESDNINFVAIGAAYENYYSNFSTNYSKCFGIVNQSFNPKIRAAFLPEKVRFENWLEKNQEDNQIINKVNSLIKVNRNFSDTPVCNELLNRIEKDKVDGKKVVCCFGKIVFDSAVPYDGGPAHSGFKDWLNHTIEIAESSPDLLVLIKPHPHELKVEIAMKIGQYLKDIIPKSLPDNVIFLDHESFNTHEIAQLADLAVLWNGTSSMELTSLGVPVMMCGHFGLYDYHLDLIYPKDRNDYVLKLRDTQKIIIDEKLKYRAMAYVSYMGHHETAIPNQYARRQLLNDPVGIPIWYEDKLVNLINLNDENMKYALDKILYNSVPC